MTARPWSKSVWAARYAARVPMSRQYAVGHQPKHGTPSAISAGKNSRSIELARAIHEVGAKTIEEKVGFSRNPRSRPLASVSTRPYWRGSGTGWR